MKVYNLHCQSGHTFEGWFGSEQDYTNQCERQLLACPFCDSTVVQRLPSAPRLNLRSAAPPERLAQRPVEEPPVGSREDTPAVTQTSGDAGAAGWMQRWLELSRQVVRETEDVGERFAHEARRMHYGEADARAIRGQASLPELESLLDEGIEVLPVLLPSAAKATLQ